VVLDDSVLLGVIRCAYNWRGSGRHDLWIFEFELA
jgi:hypothetical protein